MNKKKILFILNPIAGKRHKENLSKSIKEHLDHSRFDDDIVVTDYAGHAVALAQEAVAQQYDIVAVAGGDGSINEVGSCLIGTNIALAVLPHGSGNGLSRCLRIPLNPAKAIERINRNAVCQIDTVTVNGIPFISIAGTGYDAQVADDYAKNQHHGFDTYFRYIVKNYFTLGEKDYTLILPDKTIHTKAFFISFANSNQMGYDVPISPHACLWDGKVDICIVRKPNALELPVMSGFFLSKSMDKSPKVDIIQTDSATIVRPQADVLNIDGESITTEKDLHIQVHPLSLHVIV